MKDRAFTIKSILAGVISALLITYLSQAKILSHDLISNYLPAAAMLVIAMLSFPWNAIMGRILPASRFSKRELVVVMSMILVISWVPSIAGKLVPNMVLPQYKGDTNPNWIDAEISNYLPTELLPAGETKEQDDKVNLGMIQGLGDDAAMSDIPFDAWIAPGIQWGLIIGLMVGALISMTIIVHRQWSHHEQLRYPLASVAASLMDQDEKKGYGGLFANPLFWLGFTPIFGMLFLNYMGQWFPDALPQVPTEYNLKWQTLFPIISKSGNFAIHWYNITFLVIGIAYFIPSEVSLSVGLAPVITVFFAAQYFLVTGAPVSTGDLTIFRAGGYIGFLVILIYTGRTYYFPIFMKAFGFGPKIENEGGAVMAARTFLLAYFGLILLLWSFGLDWFIGFVFVTLTLTMFLVITRLVCESGMPNLTPGWAPPEIILKLIGPAAVGAGPLVFIFYLGSILASSHGNAATTVMPYLATTSKMGEDNGFKPNRFLVVIQILVVAALVVGFITAIYFSYTKGISSMWTHELDTAARQVFTLKERGQIESSEAISGLGKLSLIVLDPKVTSFFMAGLIAVVVTYLIRFRSSKWPFHPIIFVLVGSYSLMWSWSCFLMGWVIKSLVVKFGGGASYQKYKPVFLGLIMGEVGILALKIVVAIVYYGITGERPPEK